MYQNQVHKKCSAFRVLVQTCHLLLGLHIEQCAYFFSYNSSFFVYNIIDTYYLFYLLKTILFIEGRGYFKIHADFISPKKSFVYSNFKNKIYCNS